MAKGCINQIDEHSDKVPKEENLYFLGDAFEETELSIVLQRNLFYNSFKIFLTTFTKGYTGHYNRKITYRGSHWINDRKGWYFYCPF